MLKSTMTVQELLLQDSNIIIPVGASKLQSILLTMRDYKQKLEASTACLELLELELSEAKKEIEALRSVRVRCTSVDIDLRDL